MGGKPRWLLLTVGAGSTDFEAAAERLKRQSFKFSVFDSIVSLNTESLIRLFPELNLHAAKGTKGFGYYRWKPKVVHLALSGFWGDFDGVCFVDAGCDMNFNLISERNLRASLREAECSGAVAYQISTPERLMTKRKVLEHFNAVEDYSFQFQSGTIFLFGAVGKLIADEWDSIASLDPSYTDDSLDPIGELKDFYAHRHDQSILSLVLKKRLIKSPSHHPPAVPYPNKLNFRNLTSPIWWSRNRSGAESLRPIELVCQNISVSLKSLIVKLRIGLVLLSGNYVYLRLGGGLGNQLHQYSAAKAVSSEAGKFLLIDTQGIEKSDHGKLSNATNFKLSAMTLDSKLLSYLFFLKRRIYNKLKMYFPLKSIFIAENSGYCDDLLPQSKKISYLEGYFHTYKYSNEITDGAAYCDLVLRNQSSSWFQESLSEIKHKKVCSIHIRRGDYLNTWMHYGVLSEKYYASAVLEIGLENIDEYWIFSDATNLDLDSWTFIDHAKVKFIQPPNDTPDAESMVLMSHARWIITANSTFSWWAALLGSQSAKKIFAPEPFFRSGQKIPDLFPGDWIRLRADWTDY